MNNYLISGIQQLGIGIPRVEEAWNWYLCRFGMDLPIFREAAEAPYMTPYTGGKVHSRDAVLAINLRGGSGFEIWQYTSRETIFPDNAPLLGDLGILAGKIKTEDIPKTRQFLKDSGTKLVSEVVQNPRGESSFYLKDPYDNLFQVIPGEDWFSRRGHRTGGLAGVIIGVKDIETSLPLYRDILGYDKVLHSSEGVFPDWADLPGGKGRFRRLHLGCSRKPQGPFAPIFGSSTLELVQALDRSPRKIFEGRFWGDAGFIHLCFDVQGMDGLKKTLEEKGFPFTIDSKSSFAMGEAGGRFAYCEDPDGTLIEFVETHRIPIAKKWNWYLDLSKRKTGKALPRLLLKALGLGRVKGNCPEIP